MAHVVDWSQYPLPSQAQSQQELHLNGDFNVHLHRLNPTSCSAAMTPTIEGCSNLFLANDLYRLNPPHENSHKEQLSNLNISNHGQQYNQHVPQLMGRQLAAEPHMNNHLNNKLAVSMQGSRTSSTSALHNHVQDATSNKGCLVQDLTTISNIGRRWFDGNLEYNVSMQKPGTNVGLVAGNMNGIESNRCHHASANTDWRLVKDTGGTETNRLSKVSTCAYNQILQSKAAPHTSTVPSMRGPRPVTSHNETLSISDPKFSSSWLCSGGSHDVSPEEKEMLYRAAAMQPIGDVNPTCSTAPVDTEVGKPKLRRNVRISKDPQSVAARQRRQRISSKMRVLQKLVPGGMKMDTASMLDEAAHYLKFLKAEVEKMEAIEQLMNVAKGHFDSKLAAQAPQMHGQQKYLQTSTKSLHIGPHHGIVTPSASHQSSLLCNYPPSSVQAPHNYLKQASLSF